MDDEINYKSLLGISQFHTLLIFLYFQEEKRLTIRKKLLFCKYVIGFSMTI